MRNRTEFVTLATNEIIDLVEKHQKRKLPKALKSNIPMLMDYALNVLHGIAYTDKPSEQAQARVQPKPKHQDEANKGGARK